MMDLLLKAWVSTSIEFARLHPHAAHETQWRNGRKLKLLFAAYNGARNTGEDVRTHETIRQFRRILGEANTQFSVLAFDPALCHDYFADTVRIRFPNLFPPFLARELPKYDGVIACLGSMFQNTFADATAAFMIGVLGIASAREKIAVAYGGEAGRMSPFLSRMCRRYCGEALLIARNEDSCSALKAVGLGSECGTDTAWTFEPHPLVYGRNLLSQFGWNEHDPVLAVCPNNPYWWPVSASLAKYLASTLSGAYKDFQYRSIYFHRADAAASAGFEHYTSSIANAVTAFRSRRKIFPIVVGTEKLDRRVCDAIAVRLGGAPVFVSAEYDMFQLVSILRCAQMLVSSRFHGVVTSMPGLVPSAGVTIDERLRNLMRERGHAQLLVEATDPDLGEKLLAILERLQEDREGISDGISRTVARQIRLLARMGHSFATRVAQHYPQFPMPRTPVGWESYLPPLSPELERLMQKYAPPAETFASGFSGS